MNGGSEVSASVLYPMVPPVPLSTIRTEPPEAAPCKGVPAVPWVPPGKRRCGREGAPGRNLAAVFGEGGL
jgi:hypothetical protein